MTKFRVPIPPINAAWEDEPPASSRRPSKTKSLSMHGLASTRFFVSLDAIHAHCCVERLPSDLLSKLCSATKRAGGSFLASSDSLAAVSIRELPKRIEPIYADELPSVEAIESADGLVLQFCRSNHEPSLTSFSNLGIEWPIDVSSYDLLGKKLEMLRRLTMSTIPIGVSLPVQANHENASSDFDYRWLTKLPVDFVVLRTAASCLPKNHTALEYIDVDPTLIADFYRRLFSAAGNESVFLLVDYPWKDGYQAAGAVAAGADAVLTDRYLADRGPSLRDMLVRMDAGTVLGSNLPKTSVDLLMEQTALLIDFVKSGTSYRFSNSSSNNISPRLSW